MGKRVCCLVVVSLLCWLPAVSCRAAEEVPPANDVILGDGIGIETHLGRALPREWLERTPRKRDPSLMVSVEAVLGRAFQAGETVLIDVREPDKFAALKIPGSLNLPLFAVKTKTFLKNSRLLLFSEGYSYSDLEEQCRGLRELGFDASILDGGLRRWIENGGAVEGDARSRETLIEVPPQVFFHERHYESWVVLDVSEPGDAETASILPEAHRVDLVKEPGKGVSRVKAIGQQSQQTPFLAFLVVDRDGQSYERLDPLLRKAGLTDVYHLEGGLRAYGAFLRQQAALLEPTTSGKQATTRCPSCP